jgi:DNA-directed RNA polymerase specialized sigma24 family protein
MVSVARMASRDEFLRLIDPDPQRAAAKYKDLFLRLVKFFEWRQCESPTDLTQETILRVYSKAVSGEVTFNTEDITPYFFGVAKFVLMEDRRAAAARRAELPVDEFLPAVTVDFKQIEVRHDLRRCLSTLARDEQQLIYRYFAGERETLERDFGLSEGALRVKVHRIKERLQAIIRPAPPGPRRLK